MLYQALRSAADAVTRSAARLRVTLLGVRDRRHHERRASPGRRPTRAAQALADEELQLALDAGRIGTWQFTIGTGAVEWSPGLEAIHGYAPGAFPRTFEAFQREIHPADRDRVLEAITAASEQRRDHHIEYRIVRADGAVRWVEGRGRLVLDAQGHPARMVGVCSDITERKEADEKFRLAVEAAPTAMLVVDPKGRIELVNRLTEQLFGYERGELVGRAVEELIPARFRDTHADFRTGFLHEARQRPMGMGRDLYAMRKGGVEVPVEIGLSPIQTPDGISVIAAVTNITERKQAEQLLKTALAETDRASRVKDEFLAIVSHELRAPLNAVVGWAELLRRGLLDEAQQQRAFQTIWTNAKRQAQLVDDLLDVSRIVSGKMEVTRSAVDLHGIVNAALEGIQPEVAAKRLQLETDIERSPGNVLADAARLQQVLSNLLTNALKFTPDGGTVSLRVRRVENLVEIIVSDTGQGISPEFLPSVFEPFRQGDGSTVRRHGGLGLGLAIVKHLVEAHGGTVDAHSAGEGRGATFTVRLPIVAVYAEDGGSAPAPASSPVSAPPSDRGAVLAGITVLVVDDDQDARQLVTLVLQSSGAVVLSAASAAEAFVVLRRGHVDVVLADVAMPGEDGYALMRRLREMETPAAARIPAAALTSFASHADRQRALQAGFQLHLAKPLESRTLIDAVATLVGRVAAH